jgi:MoaA/NifB/PqqE/SkfB family radical SAM enzyme
VACGTLSVTTAARSLRRQMVISSLLSDAKPVQVGSRVFVDPFVPYFPSPYCEKLFDNNTSPAYPPKPNFAQLAVTNRCPCRCVHCHVKNTQDTDLSRETVLEVIPQLAEADFPLVFFVGGEPLSRFVDLLDFVDLARQFMDTRMFTSGVGASPERLRRLREVGLEGICVSLDHDQETIHNAKRNHPSAYASACNTIREAAGLGFYVSVVCCTTRSMVRSGETFAVVDLAESLGAHSVQLNEIRPVGRALESQGYDFFLTQEEKTILIDYYARMNRSRRRIAICMPWYNEEPYRFGCTATSGQQAYIDGKGNVLPCPLLKAGLGNIGDEPFRDIWTRFRSHCGHPVRECIVHRLAEEMERSPSLPLPPARTLALWPACCRLAPPDAFESMHGVLRETP